MKKSTHIMLLFLAAIGLMALHGCASVRPPAHLPHSYSGAIAEASPEIEGKRPHSSDEALRKLEKDGSINLSLSDCLKIALQHNYDIRLTREALTQADTRITQARSAMLPFLGAEASYTRLDEELSITMGPQSLTFMDRDQYKAGFVIRQPIFTGGRLNAARKASQYSRDAQAQGNRALEDEVVFQVTRAYRTAQLAEAFQDVAVEAVELLKAHEHDVAILVEKGANPEIDLLRTRTELANARKDLNGADNAVDLAYSALKNLLIIPLEKSVHLTETLVRLPGPEADLSSLTELALSQRPELSAIDFQAAAAEQALKAARGEYLPAIALEGLLADNVKAGTFVRDNFKGIFFAKGVHGLIDTIRSNIDKLSGFKKNIALFALGKTCMSGKGGFGHFSSSTRYGKREDTPEEFKERLRKNVARINALVFDNGKECKGSRKDINDFLPETKADLAYFDPPYATEFSTTNYEKSYHFVEGLMTYWEGLTLVEDSKTKHYETDHKTVTRANAAEFFESFLRNAKHIPHWLISYCDHAYPNESEMRRIIASMYTGTSFNYSIALLLSATPFLQLSSSPSLPHN